MFAAARGLARALVATGSAVLLTMSAWADAAAQDSATARAFTRSDSSGSAYVVEPWTPPDTFASRVALEVATRWGVGVERIALDWSDNPGAPPVDARDRFILIGQGTTGSWIVTIDPTPAHGALRLHLRAGVEELATIATRKIARGTVLTRTDIALVRVLNWGPPSRTTTRCDAGWITRRVIMPDEVLREPAVAPPPLVAPGQTVDYIVARAGINLTIRGVAMGSAYMGDRVWVRLGATRRALGIVTGKARVAATDSLRIT
jgi:flagella basal body P-ring formation protein FlgA